MVALKYGEERGGWTSKLGMRVHRCDLWRGIRMGWEDFSKNCQFVVGLGNRVRFWQDGWYGDHLFRLAFQGCMVSPLIRRFLLKLFC